MFGLFKSNPDEAQEGQRVELRVDKYGQPILADVGTGAKEATDMFVRPANATPYTAGDVIARTTSTTADVGLRELDLAIQPGRPFWLTYLRLDTNLTTFLGAVRVHFYTVPKPSTALVGDNSALVQYYANRFQKIGYVDLPVLVLQHSGDDFVTSVTYINSIDAQLPMLMKPAEGDTRVYYMLEAYGAGPTPASGQSFLLIARSSDS